MIILKKKFKSPLYLQIYQQVKEKIISGQITEESRLPSIRALSESLDVSKNTVTYAYRQLCSEGYIINRTRSGFYAQKLDNHLFSLAVKKSKEPPSNTLEYGEPDSHPSICKYDFQYGKLNPRDFPINLWRKLSNQLLSAPNLGKMVSYPDRRGEQGLRVEIMRYLHGSRGVICQPDQIVISPGTQLSLSLLSRFLKQTSSSIAMEDPGYDGARVVFKNNGLDIIPIGLENGGLKLDELELCTAKAIYTTPSRQFPTGEVMPIQKRIKLLEWARKNNTVIIEDDYDSELRYSGRPIPSIQSIDTQGQVIYLGTFSKSLSPALRMSYMVIPEPMLKGYQDIFERYNNFVPWLEQKIVEKFISGGHWERHLRKARQANKKRHDILTHTIKKTMGNKVMVHGINAGLHVILEFKDKVSEKKLIQRAKKHGVAVYPVSQCWIRRDLYKKEMILLGYSGMDETDIINGIQILNKAWFDY